MNNGNDTTAAATAAPTASTAPPRAKVQLWVAAPLLSEIDCHLGHRTRTTWIIEACESKLAQEADEAARGQLWKAYRDDTIAHSAMSFTDYVAQQRDTNE